MKSNHVSSRPIERAVRKPFSTPLASLNYRPRSPTKPILCFLFVFDASCISKPLCTCAIGRLKTIYRFGLFYSFSVAQSFSIDMILITSTLTSRISSWNYPSYFVFRINFSMTKPLYCSIILDLNNSEKKNLQFLTKNHVNSRRTITFLIKKSNVSRYKTNRLF